MYKRKKIITSSNGKKYFVRITRGESDAFYNAQLYSYSIFPKLLNECNYFNNSLKKISTDLVDDYTKGNISLNVKEENEFKDWDGRI
jgi:hypothetical protein